MLYEDLSIRYVEEKCQEYGYEIISSEGHVLTSSINMSYEEHTIQTILDLTIRIRGVITKLHVHKLEIICKHNILTGEITYEPYWYNAPESIDIYLKTIKKNYYITEYENKFQF